MEARKIGRFLAGAFVIGGIASPSIGQAAPYAEASNLITGLTVTYADGSSLTNIGSATTNVSDFAIFGGFAPSGANNAGIVGNALTIPQAYSGPGPAPPASFSPAGPGAFTGTRADAAIGAGNASSGGVSVSNIAEGQGNAVGNSTGNNSATITWQVTGTGQAVKLSFTDAINLIASTDALPLETATASLTNSFSVTAQAATSPLATFQPAELNQQLSSQFGTPPTNSLFDTAFYTFTSPILTAGTVYNISLSSAASENILPGTAIPTPEPGSLVLLGTGLLGLGWMSRRKLG